jgi:hypothetical protein
LLKTHSLARRAQLIQWTNNPIAPGTTSRVATPRSGIVDSCDELKQYEMQQ